jgi:hypothetical protein
MVRAFRAVINDVAPSNQPFKVSPEVVWIHFKGTHSSAGSF